MPATPAVSIARLVPDSAAARRLIALSDAHMASLYPGSSVQAASVEALRAPNVAFFGVHLGAELVGCGAVKVAPDDPTCAELKRVFVVSEQRGRGISKLLIAALEQHLRAIGVRTARLETGMRQTEALGLYARLGYVERGPFGACPPDPLSVFMEKSLAA